jgi:hypothetical protein
MTATHETSIPVGVGNPPVCPFWCVYGEGHGWETRYFEEDEWRRWHRSATGDDHLIALEVFETLGTDGTVTRNTPNIDLVNLEFWDADAGELEEFIGQVQAVLAIVRRLEAGQ